MNHGAFRFLALSSVVMGLGCSESGGAAGPAPTMMDEGGLIAEDPASDGEGIDDGEVDDVGSDEGAGGDGMGDGAAGTAGNSDEDTTAAGGAGSISVDASGACQDFLEPNDTASSACPATLDQLIVSGLSAEDTVDVFAFDALANHTYTLDVIATNACSSFGISSSAALESQGQERVQLLDELGQSTTRVTRELTPPADGRVSIELKGNCSYELVVWQSVADGLVQNAETFEPNNSPSTAAPLALDRYVASAVTSAPDPSDLYAVAVTEGVVYTLDVMATGACSSFGIGASVSSLSESGRTELLSKLSQSTARTAREFTASTNGVAVVELGGNCAYELAVLKSTSAGLLHDEATLEPNNSPSTGTRLDLDEVATSTVTSALDPDDYFGVPVTAGRVYTLELIGRNGCSTFGISAGVNLAAASGSSTLLAAASQSTTRTAREFSPNADGTAVVEVSGQCAYDVVVHQASVDGLAQDEATFEPNNSPSTAAPLPLDTLITSQTQSGEDPDDFFVVPVEADQTYTLQLTGTGACTTFGISSAATLSSAAGTSPLLATSSQGTNTSARELTPAADGEAIIRIAGNCGYELQVLSP